MFGRIGALLFFWRTLRLAWRLLRDRRVPLANKLIVPGSLLYALFPLDLLPDFLPALGQVNDVTVLIVSVTLFVWTAPRRVVREHLDRMAGRSSPPQQEHPDPTKVIDGQYEILDDGKGSSLT